MAIVTLLSNYEWLIAFAEHHLLKLGSQNRFKILKRFHKHHSFKERRNGRFRDTP
jgi:hypothetical protein